MSTVAHSFSNRTFPLDHIPSSHSYRYSTLFLPYCTYSPLFTQLGCVCLPILIVLFFVCVFMIWFFLFCCCFCDLVFLSLLVFFCFAGTTRHFPVFPHTISGEQRNSKATSLQIGFQEYQTNHHPNAKMHCKQFVELARCERVMTTRAEFHFSWVYSFSATPRSLRI